jgi:propionyl-CoA carboxylase alpha chain
VATDVLAGTVVSTPPVPDSAAVAAALALAADDAVRRTVQRGIPAGWRNVVSQPQRVTLEGDRGEVTVEWLGTRDGFVVDGVTVLEVVSTGSTDEWRVRLEVDGVATTYRVSQTRGQKSSGGGLPPREVWVDGPVLSARLREVPRFTDPADAVASGSLLAPMPGTVVKVLAEQGTAVTAGQPVLVLEAMKMQHTVAAPTDGTVTTIDVVAGAQVAAGEVLAVVTDDRAPAEGDEQ